MTDLRGLVGEMASARAGTGVAVLQACHRPGAGSSLRTFDAGGRSAFADTGFAVHDLLRRVDEVLRPDGRIARSSSNSPATGPEAPSCGTPSTCLPWRRCGWCSTRLSPPQPPDPPMPAPPGVAVTDRLTDPEVLATIRALVAEFVSGYTRTTGRTPDFGAGHSEEEIRAAEAAMGLRLPEDLRALYRTVSSDEEYGLLMIVGDSHPERGCSSSAGTS